PPHEPRHGLVLTARNQGLRVVRSEFPQPRELSLDYDGVDRRYRLVHDTRSLGLPKVGVQSLDAPRAICPATTSRTIIKSAVLGNSPGTPFDIDHVRFRGVICPRLNKMTQNRRAAGCRAFGRASPTENRFFPTRTTESSEAQPLSSDCRCNR